MTDIMELFSRDALSLSKQNIASIVEEMRKSRHAFNAGNMKAGSTKPKTEKQKQALSLAGVVDIKL